MIQLKIVKNLLLIISLSVISVPTFAKGNVRPIFNCGIHKIIGQLSLNQSGQFILTANKGSYSPFEIILLGGSFSEKMSRRDTKVEADVYVPKKIDSNNAPFVYLQKIASVSDIKNTKEVESMKCNINEYFKQKP